MKTKTSFFQLYFAFTLFSLFTANLAAQPSRIASDAFGLFRNDADSFMDPNDYETVEFEKFFFYIQHSPDFQQAYDFFSAPKPAGMGNDILSAGYAGYLGSVYIGGFFEGNLYERFRSSLTPNGTAYTVYDTLSVLIGAEPVGGIVLMAGYQCRDQTIGGVSGSAENLSFGGGWGKNFTLNNGFLIKPQVGFIYSENEINIPRLVKERIYELFTGISMGTSDINYSIAGSAEADLELRRSGNALPIISAGYTFVYIDMPLSPVVHVLSTSYKRVYDLNDRFSVGFGFGLDILFAAAKGTVSGTPTNATMLALIPNSQAGFTYKFNSPFSVNAGINVDYDLGYRYTQTGDKSHPFAYLGNTFVSTRAGGCFQPNENLAIDFSYATGYYTANMGDLSLGLRFKK
jgi:opacity protein-like surface antigen